MRREAGRGSPGAWRGLLWNLGGTVFLALGLLGVPLPILPTTPFLLLSAACYLRGSPRMHSWMMTNRFFGAYLAGYRAGQGIPLKTKVAAIVVLWIAIGASVLFVVEALVWRVLLLLIAVAVTTHIALISMRERPAVRLIGYEKADAPLVERWLWREHVRRWWGDPNSNLRLLSCPPEGTRIAIIETAGERVGLVVWSHPPRGELDEAGLHDLSTAAIDIDIMIGEPGALGRGVGTEAIRLVASRVQAEDCPPYLMAATSVANHASRRAFERAGFRVDRQFDDPQWGRCFLLIRDCVQRPLQAPA